MLLSTARGVSSTPRDAVPHTAGGAAHPWLACEGACEGGNVCCANVRYPHRRYTPATFGGDGVANGPESVFKIAAAAGFPAPSHRQLRHFKVAALIQTCSKINTITYGIYKARLNKDWHSMTLPPMATGTDGRQEPGEPPLLAVGRGRGLTQDPLCVDSDTQQLPL
jgi:hypothetical protein